MVYFLKVFLETSISKCFLNVKNITRYLIDSDIHLQ